MNRHIKNLIQLYEEGSFLIIIDEGELKNFIELQQNTHIGGYMLVKQY
jgi:hypothetical protein